MAVSLRRTALRGSALAGTLAVGVAYYQRLPASNGDHRTAWKEGLASRAYQAFGLPLIVHTDAELAHLSTIRVAQVWQSLRQALATLSAQPTPVDWLLRPSPSVSCASGPSLRQDLFGGRLRFESPLGIAAGFDKNAALVPLYRSGGVPGLGFAEVGSVSAEPCDGNARPRCWRLPQDRAVINFMGLNNEGAATVAERLQGFAALDREQAERPRTPVGINIAKTHKPSICGEAAVEDFVSSFRKLAPLADFVVINVSCPNTAEGKTFEEPEALRGLLQAIAEERGSTSWSGPEPPVLVKLVAPPETPEGQSRLRELVAVIQASGTVDGMVISNTMPFRDATLSAEGQEIAAAAGRGGLSGCPLEKRSTAAIRTAFEATRGQLPIVGVGGVDSADTAYAKIRAGASLVEIYTGLVYKGPWLLADAQLGLRRLLERDGFSCIAEAVGADATC